MQYWIKLQRFLEFLESYDFQVPVSKHLQTFYNQHKNMGSRDRREFSSWIYQFFRLNNAVPGTSPEQRLAIAVLMLGAKDANNIKLIEEQLGAPEDLFEKSQEDRMTWIKLKVPAFDLERNFAYGHLLSDRINQGAFKNSMLRQPRVWIRMRKDFEEDIKSELRTSSIPFIQDAELPLALSFSQGVKLESTEGFRKGKFEIQDRSSQLCASFFHPKEKEYWWDCCAGSGGKSLLLLDKQPKINLTVSDKRERILNNLRERFERNNVKQYQMQVLDLLDEKSVRQKINSDFDSVVADVPCSGSGTWARTPEMLSAFKESSLEEFAGTQERIIGNAKQKLKNGGILYYVTCSVFRRENEDHIPEFIKMGLELIESQYLEGSLKEADTLYMASFKKVKE